MIGILAIVIGLFFIILDGIVPALMWFALGIPLVFISILESKAALSEMENSSIDRSKSIIYKIGGIDNIDINLSKYGNESQLIILKDKSIHIGHNNYETEKIINFDSIINVDIRINNIKEESLAGYTNYHRDVIESIIVYIHTNECTEELVFKYSSYKTNQEKYNEILKNLNRFKAIIDDTLDRNDLYSKTNINYKEKSIPEQVKEYKELLDMDAITREEYESLKKDLLSKLRA